MVATTIAYLGAVSIAASLGALLADAGLRRLRLPTRWTWLGAMMLGPVLLGGGALLRSVSWGAPAAIPVAVPVTLDLQALVPRTSAAPGFAWRDALEQALGIGWLSASVALLWLLVRAHRTLEREKGAWRARRIRGATVFVSERCGPAVSGLRRGWIVLPAWVLGLPRPEIRLVLRHEGEHLRAGDSRLVLSGLVLAALTPWNPFAWWQLRRLRTAVEIDCDRRVLARTADVGAYGAALLSIAAGVMPDRPLAFAAFSENAHTLKTRILTMTAIRSRWTGLAGVLLVLVAVVVTIQACGVEAPPSPTAPLVGERGAQRSDAITEAPSFTPFTVAPQLTNREEVGRALEMNYSASLRDAGVTGKAQVWIRITEQGAVDRVSIHRSSGTEALDAAAVAVGRVMKFTPAVNRDEVVAVWVSLPITFQVTPPVRGAADESSTSAPGADGPAVQSGDAITVTGTRRSDAAAAGAPDGVDALEEGAAMLKDGRFDDAVASFRRAVEAGEARDAAAQALYRDAVTRGIRVNDWPYALRGLVAAKAFAGTAETRTELDFWHGWALYHQAMGVEKPQTPESARVALPMFEEARALFLEAEEYAARSGANLPRILDAVDQYLEIQSVLLRR